MFVIAGRTLAMRSMVRRTMGRVIHVTKTKTWRGDSFHRWHWPCPYIFQPAAKRIGQWPQSYGIKFIPGIYLCNSSNGLKVTASTPSCCYLSSYGGIRKSFPVSTQPAIPALMRDELRAELKKMDLPWESAHRENSQFWQLNSDHSDWFICFPVTKFALLGCKTIKHHFRPLFAPYLLWLKQKWLTFCKLHHSLTSSCLLLTMSLW